MPFYSGLSWCFFSTQPNVDAKKNVNPGLTVLKTKYVAKVADMD